MVHRFIRAGALLGMAVGLALPGAAQSAESFRLLSSWGSSNTTAYMPGLQFKKNLEAAGDYSVRILGPEAAPPFEQLQPVSAGVFDLLYTHSSYHSKGLAIGADAMKPDMEKMRATGIFDHIDKYYQKTHNIKLLSLVPVGDKGYHCYLREPLSADGDWKGRKIRGVATYHGVIKALGGVPVQTDMGEVYAALERGVIDGACAPANVLLATKHYEVAKYRTEPTFGTLVSLIGINLDRWNKLTDAQKETLSKVGAQTEKDTMRLGNEILINDNKALDGLGVKPVQFPPAVAQKVNSSYYSSIWELAAQCCGEDGKKLHELAKAQGLTE